MKQSNKPEHSEHPTIQERCSFILVTVILESTGQHYITGTSYRVKICVDVRYVIFTCQRDNGGKLPM